MSTEDDINVGAAGVLQYGASSGNVYVVVAAAAWLVGDYLYNRYWGDKPAPPKPSHEGSIPSTADGSVVPLIYGRIRTTNPVLAWIGLPTATDVLASGDPTFIADLHSSPFLYTLPMFFNLGITPRNARCRLYAVWMGDLRAQFFDLGSPGAWPDRYTVDLSNYPDIFDGRYRGGLIDLYPGSDDQTLVDGSGASTSYVAAAMISSGVDGTQIPAYRGVLSLNLSPWLLGVNANVDRLSFEISAYPENIHSALDIGDDMNPAVVIRDILTGSLGKLGIDDSRIDNDSFTIAAITLQAEGDGYSRVFDRAATAEVMLSEILQQIDGILYEDQSTQKIFLKLIRADYDLSNIPTINPNNCKSLDAFSITSWTDIPNRIKILFTNRINSYNQGTAISISQSNAVGQDGEVRELIINMPGVMTQEQADIKAAREMQSRCRPLMKCRAIVSRQFYPVRPGDAVMVNWPESNLSNMIFRAVTATRGTLQDGKITLQLVQDYFYQWRRRPPAPPHNGSGGIVVAHG